MGDTRLFTREIKGEDTMTMIDKNTVLFTYGEDNEHKQTVGTFLELVKNEDVEKLYSIGETLESEGKSLGKELNEIAGTFETLIDSLLTTLEGENTK